MTPITFKCKRSGNTVSFTLPGDIEGMRKHEGYTEIKNEEVKVEEAAKEVLKRTRKSTVPAFLQE